MKRLSTGKCVEVKRETSARVRRHAITIVRAVRSRSSKAAASFAAVLLGRFLSVALGTAGLHVGILHLGDNFHAVVPGELYRSAQPTPELITDYHVKYGIKTVINLRGENVGSDWYD